MPFFSSNNSSITSAGRDGSSWPVLLLLLAVLVPSGGVIWMMRQAMENERLAVRQRMTDFYNVQLESAQQRVVEHWQERLTEIGKKTSEKTPSEQFAKFVTEKWGDSLIVWGAGDSLQYPDRLKRSPEANTDLQQLGLLESSSPEWNVIADRLRRRLNRYDAERLSAPQRRFLMRELAERWPEQFEFAKLEAESLAAEFLETSNYKPPTVGLQSTQIEGVWSLHSPEKKTTALFHTATLRPILDRFLTDQRLPPGVSLQILDPDETPEAEHSISLGPVLPGWRLAIISDGDHSYGGSERVALFAWTALALIAVTLLFTWLVVRSWWEQMRIARLKNDLVATVSHELKTPLSSIRLLVDTLLDQNTDTNDHGAIQGRSREYLELISQENARLTRLIDNFLTFSRMERGKRTAKLVPIDVREVVAQAAGAMRERFATADDCELVIEAHERAPVLGDMDLLVTSVVNLLDNAWKYSGESKRVHLSCDRQEKSVVITVEDNGVGLSPKATEKIFNRFYQVDQRLARSHEGCGLGLSIVKYLVEAHGGEVTVESQPGVGSTFSIWIPLDGEGSQR